MVKYSILKRGILPKRYALYNGNKIIGTDDIKHIEYLLLHAGHAGRSRKNTAFHCSLKMVNSICYILMTNKYLKVRYTVYHFQYKKMDIIVMYDAIIIQMELWLQDHPNDLNITDKCSCCPLQHVIDVIEFFTTVPHKICLRI